MIDSSTYGEDEFHGSPDKTHVRGSLLGQHVQGLPVVEYDGRELVEPPFCVLELDIVLIPFLKSQYLGIDVFYRIQLLEPSKDILFPMELDFQVLDSVVVCLFDDVSRSDGMSVPRIVSRA